MSLLQEELTQKGCLSYQVEEREMFFEDVSPVFNNDNVILWTVVHQAPLSKRTPISNTLALVAQMVKNLPVMWETQV